RRAHHRLAGVQIDNSEVFSADSSLPQRLRTTHALAGLDEEVGERPFHSPLRGGADNPDRTKDLCVLSTTGSPRAICSYVMEHSHNFTSQDCERSGSDYEPFKSLEFKESRQRSLWMSLVVHGVLLTVLLLIPMLFT